jgi:chromosome segregation ATPase
MTIDERLEKLTERHETLTQSVELLRIAQEETDRRFKRVADLFAQTDGFINDLARIARSHEDRLDNIERHNPKQ